MASGLVIGVTGSVAATTDAAAREAVDGAIGLDGAVVITADTASDAAQQDAAVRELLADRFTSADITRSETAGPIAVDGVASGVEFVADPGLPDAATLVDGAWPAAGQTAVQASAAQALGLAVGDTVTAEGADLEVSGTWQPTDPLAPRWAAVPASTSGRDGDTAGPLLVTADELAGPSTSRWVVVPGDQSLADVARAADRAALTDAFAVSGAAGAVTVSGGLAETAARAVRTSDAAAGLTAAALLLLLVVVIVGSSRLIVLGARRRASADELLRARGASRGQLIRWSMGEVVAVAAPAAVIGAVVGHLVSTVVTPQAGWSLEGVLGVVALVAALIVTAAVQPVPLTRPRRRSAGALRGVGIALLLAAAAVAVWQLDSATGELGVAGIAAVPLLVLALALAATAGASAWVLRRTRLGRTTRAPWLFVALRSLRARATSFSATALVVVLASALCVAAAVLPAAVTTAERSVAVDENGAELRAGFALGPIVTVGDEPAPVAVIAEAPEVAAAAAVLTTDVEVGDDQLTAVVLPAARAEALTGIAFAPRSQRPSGIGGTAVGIGIGITSRGFGGTLSGTAWLASADGALAAIDLGAAPVGAEAVLTGALPAGFADAELLTIDLRLEGADSATVTLDEVSGLDAQGAATAEIAADRLSRDAFSLSSGQQRATIVVDGTDAPLPVALSASAAALLGLAVGDELDVSRTSGRDLPATVAAIVPVVPGAEGARSLAIDTADFARASLDSSSSLPTPSDVWVATDDPKAVARVVAANADSSWTVRGGGSPFVSAGVAVWGVAAAVAVLMALVALAANGALLRRLRAGDEAALAALGLTARERRARRLVENGIVAGASVIAGALVGAAASALCLPAASALAVGGATRPAPLSAVDGPLLLGLLGALLVAVVGGVVAASHERRDTTTGARR
ncbi:hypothetical protein SAMN06295885_3541 [Rathayibacter oskolensis]|uniref:ABC3 transporter permease C-terminal domain-containing protein n=1 Tax=Rathayibacter oskolensis TaxID=1891671 RepID=A0A1X7PGA8_9MICO|nr:hypothetical protein SAMN06295885_3541 [Rathayibacter oskolensis]